MQLLHIILGYFISSPYADNTSDRTKHNSPSAKEVAMIEQRSNPAAYAASNSEANPDHTFHKPSVAQAASPNFGLLYIQNEPVQRHGFRARGERLLNSLQNREESKALLTYYNGAQ